MCMHGELLLLGNAALSRDQQAELSCALDLSADARGLSGGDRSDGSPQAAQWIGPISDRLHIQILRWLNDTDSDAAAPALNSGVIRRLLTR